MSITWDLPVQRRLCQNFVGNFGGTCIYIYKKKIYLKFSNVSRKRMWENRGCYKRFQCQPWNWVSVMIFVSGGTLFSSMIYEVDVVFGRRRSQCQPRNLVPVMIFGSGGT